ncbi:hypothetical protein [Bosea sp. (in: a-proteobacteria)]|uniref:hypothetical protein n=1 Tax=Bosea sp. (in: a-proteobacteria) TaxID=1871050 RepID=UPI0027356EA2|nr:hypothetical protein [Bosea sp. (in: a-proteobacteria)]MDP3254565.1 hypothetical protein [Bosea sp. (in: a-proteobacteria)]
MRLIKLFWRNERGTLVADLAKAGAAIAFLSVVAANVISNQTAHFDRERLAQVAAAAAGGRGADPMTTGSLRKAAAETKLDPCVLPR